MIPTDLSALRRFYASEIAVVAGLRTPRLEEAFAAVPREQFLGPGPWDLAGMDPRRPGSVIYRRTPDDDPRHLYHNVAVAIDTARELNNGHPSSLAAWLDALAPAPGETFVHVGCGVGYYTAIAAHVVGPGGRVVAFDVDEGLATRARANLRGEAHVRVIAGDGASHGFPDGCDAILVNAGFTHVLPHWIGALSPGGRLLVPITAGLPGSPIGTGGMLLVTRRRDGPGWRARLVSAVAIFSSPSGRDEAVSPAIRQALGTGAWLRVESLRVDTHEKADDCCIHFDGACLSSREPM
jgi:protein-L-isoaspartate(D-aspartate) O-methyltransferase